LRVLAGLLQLDEGSVAVDGTTWDDGQTHLPPHRRPLGVVFQDALLFPHLSVGDNVAFGLRTRGVGRAQARTTAAAWLERVGLDGLERQRPAQLSGGQAQRAALARALVGDPALLLLDEPLSALDARTRLTVRAELRRHLGAFGGSTVLVTHDPVDAMALADRVVVVEEGRVVQAGTPVEVSRRPRTDYVARLVGLSLLPGTGQGRSVLLDDGGVVAVSEETAGPVFAAVRPESVALYLSRPDGSPRNVWPLRLVGATPHGATVRCELAGQVPLVADVTATAFAELGLVPGAEVWATVKASEVAVYAR
jgi:molybdate transport system ATP-binding protein